MDDAPSGDASLQRGELRGSERGEHVGESVVEADLDMLRAADRFARLRGVGFTEREISEQVGVIEMLPGDRHVGDLVAAE